MIRNSIYREALERVVQEIPLADGSLLVTGATGLIGSCLIDLLMLANDYGRRFDIYALGRNIDRLKERFAAFASSELLHFVGQDVRKPLDGGLEFDYIIHGASNADPKSYALYPTETMLINLEGAKNVLEYCKTHQQTKALMMSTFEVYGNAGQDIYREDDFGIVDINAIRSCYPESKRCMEILTRCYVEEHGVNAVIGRLCSIYGPTMSKGDSKAHAQFMRNALRGENIILKSKGEQRRTYCYVIDAVTGLLTVLARGTRGEAYNIANENAIATIAEVAQTIADIAGTMVTFELPDEVESKGFSKPQNCILDNQKLRCLGWQGHYDVTKGMKECLNILAQNNRN